MKITILQGAFLPIPPALGGAVEKMWFGLSKEFASKGHEVTYISRAFDKTPREEWIDGVRHKRIKGFDAPASGVYLKILDLIYTLRSRSVIPNDSDVVVTNTFWAPIVLPSNIRHRSMVDVQRMPKGQTRFYKSVACLRANSTSVYKAIKAEIGNTQNCQVTHIPNPLPFTASSGINLDKKKAVVLYVGRIHPEKGLELLIDAFNRLDTDWTLKIVGPFEVSAGGGGKQYFEKLKNLAKTQKIEFAGPVFDINVLNQFYQEASIFVYPSIAEKGETFGLAPLEAMAWGCVTIVSNLECFKDFIVHGRNGLVFDHRNNEAPGQLRDAMRQVIDNREYRKALAKICLRVRKTHSIPSIASRFLETFEQLIRERNAPYAFS